MGAREGRYGYTQGPIMGFESRAISAWVTKQIVTILVKRDNNVYFNLNYCLQKMIFPEVHYNIKRSISIIGFNILIL